jgi:UDP-N-acetylmuramoyl-L-alanyl-D-glutamate--2,6-diaminopimelate ligase
MNGVQQLSSPRAAASWLAERCPGTLRSDSRQVRHGDAFVAWPGASVDGRSFVGAALAAGAGACLVEADGVESFALDPSRVAGLAGLKAMVGEVADAWFGQPTAKLRVLAVTGTNGKTSTCWWLAEALRECGVRCGVVGTLGIGEPPQLRDGALTTPDAVALQAAFAGLLAQGVDACAVEASSIGLAEHRLAGTRIAVALFTNFTQDHLDYHGDMARYWQAKRRLFDWPGLRAAVVNVDDPQGALLARELAAVPGLREGGLWTVSTREDARLRARDIRYVDGGLAFDIEESAGCVPLRTGLVGDYNVHNLLVVLGGLRALDVPLEAAVAAMRGLGPVPGRLQRVGEPGRQPEVVVDYAHTPDALQKVLESLAPLAKRRGGALWCVFGCGGDRDPAKRPLMGAIAAERCDHVIVTSDNPRSEAPEAIIEQIVAGVAPALAGKVRCEADRAKAIARAVGAAGVHDVLLIAGKGHEDYQEIAGRRLRFSDVQQAGAALAARQERLP